MSVDSLTMQLRELQAKLVKALQEEYFCEDLEPPPAAFGWDADTLRKYFEDGGVEAAAPPASSAASADQGRDPKPGQPGGGLEQPATSFSVPPMALPAAGGMELLPLVSGADGVARYQANILATGIPPRRFGLFPPDDALLKRLTTTHKPYTKALPHLTADGTFAFATVADGWASGESAARHGMDLRMFIKPGAEQKLVGALRFSDYAMIGRGAPNSSIHGGAVETALDEATAECAKSKLYSVAVTTSIEFKITKAVQPQTTYLVECEVTKKMSDIRHEIMGYIKDADGKVTVATAKAVLADLAGIPGAFQARGK